MVCLFSLRNWCDKFVHLLFIFVCIQPLTSVVKKNNHLHFISQLFSRQNHLSHCCCIIVLMHFLMIEDRRMLLLVCVCVVSVIYSLVLVKVNTNCCYCCCSLPSFLPLLQIVCSLVWKFQRSSSYSKGSREHAMMSYCHLILVQKDDSSEVRSRTTVGSECQVRVVDVARHCQCTVVTQGSRVLYYRSHC